LSRFITLYLWDYESKRGLYNKIVECMYSIGERKNNAKYK